MNAEDIICSNLKGYDAGMEPLNPHFAVQSGNGFNPDVELL